MGQSDYRKRSSVRWRARGLWSLVIFIAASLFATASTNAASRHVKERAARKACLSGDYVKGVSILSDLFVDTKDPTYIFNQARCFQQNRRYEDAVARFQEFLRTGPDLDPSDKAAAEKHIADCQDLIAKQTAQPVQPVGLTSAVQQSLVQQPPPSFTPQVAPATILAPAPAIAQTSPQPDATSGSGFRTAGIATASVGAAALVTGILLNLHVNSMASDMKITGGYSDSKESQRKNYETAGWISYGVGAACVATGAILYYLGLRSSSHRSPALSLLPVLTPNQAGAAVGGSF